MPSQASGQPIALASSSIGAQQPLGDAPAPIVIVDPELVDEELLVLVGMEVREARAHADDEVAIERDEDAVVGRREEPLRQVGPHRFVEDAGRNVLQHGFVARRELADIRSPSLVSSTDIRDQRPERRKALDPAEARLIRRLVVVVERPVELGRHMDAQAPALSAGTTSDCSELPTIIACAAPSPWRVKMRS